MSGLHEISLFKLQNGDEQAVNTLLKACKTDGCFYLNLQRPDGNGDESCHQSVGLAQDVARLAREFFNLPLEEKMQWEMDKWADMHIGGYKAIGKHSGVVEGTRDGFENFLIPLNALLALDEAHLPWPPILDRQLSLLESFEFACYSIARQILVLLSNKFHEDSHVRFEDLHRWAEPSTTTLAMLKYPPSVALTKGETGHMAHTDVGSLTILFASAPGLEIYSSATSTWVPADPRRGSVVVNVGDTLSFMSGTRLKSCVHRVLPNVSHCNSDGSRASRFSLAFFLRPELSARFLDAEGTEWTAKQWHLTKYKVFRANNDEQRSSSLLTGRRGFLGEWRTAEPRSDIAISNGNL